MYRYGDRNIYKTLFFILLGIVILIGLYIVIFKYHFFGLSGLLSFLKGKPTFNETVYNNALAVISNFDGVDIHSLKLEELAAIGEPAIPALAKILEDENSTADQRWAAIMGLSDLGHRLNSSRNVLPYLIKALEDTDVNVRVTAATLVMSHGSKEGIPVLIAQLENSAILKPTEPPMPINSYCAESLAFYTTQTYGIDKTQWQSWWDTNKDKLRFENGKFTA
ncbi:MAG: HEAT repeat domain-containing protein [Candidatus Pacearchaeota archaeon]|nr:HEAT repeat domain-containing protein [Candidatus Pacearchaeota archaeon]